MSRPNPPARLKTALPALAALLATLPLTAEPARAGEVQFKPNLSLSEEYNDNILESATDRRTDWVSRVRPGASLNYLTPRLGSDLAYSFDYRNYARRTRGDETVHNLAFSGFAALTENRLFLELHDTLKRVSLSVARDVTTESLFLNQSDQNVASVSPYLLWRPGTKGQLKTGYTFSDTRYWDRTGISKRQHRAYADFTQELSGRLTLNASYAFGNFDTDVIDYRQHDLSAGLPYEYADKCFLYGSAGNSWQSFARLNSVSNLFWNAGLSHDFGMLVATLDGRVQYTEDPLAVSTKQTSYTARLERGGAKQLNLALAGGYSKYEGTFGGRNDRTSLSVSGSGRYQCTERFSVSLSTLGDRVRGGSDEGYPYHLNGSVAFSYLFNYDINATLSYGYLQYRRSFASATDARETNRGSLELTKGF